MISTAILSVLLCSIFCAAQNQKSNFTISDDQANWASMWKAMSATTNSDGRSDVADSIRSSLFDIILRANAQARHKSRLRSGESEFLFQGDIAMNKRDVVSILRGGARRKRAVMKKLATKLWQPNKIAYVISSDLGTFAKQAILAAIKQWEATLPCMGKWNDISKLDSRKRPRDYIRFIKGEGCYSRVGRQGGRQVISIGKGCEQIGVVIHEIGHAMGFWHEQSRTDRDQYVVIHWNNILPAMRFNFEKYSSSKVNDLGVGYDYESVMHYGAKAFSKNRALTISIKPEKKSGVRLGQRYRLSVKDKKQAQLLYNCNAKPLPCSSSPCLNGGVCRNNGDKYSCTCTSGYSGVRCETKPLLCSSYPCLNRGVCRNNGDKYSCRCTSSYTGERCEKKKVTVQTCVDKDKLCDTWGKGGYCGPEKGYEAFMKNSCCATCRRYTTVKPLPCSSSPCLNSGACTNNGDKYICTCTSRYTGTRCETRVKPCSSSPCLNSGVCRNNGDKYSCTCTSSYTGTRCQTKVNPCSLSPCLNSGVCRNSGDTYRCSCTAGYTGTRCQVKVLPCSSSPCLNGGVCTNNGDKYSCRCTSYYTGVRCETKTRASTGCTGNTQTQDNCERWKSYCVRGSKYYSYMKKNCCKTCEDNCKDKNIYCARWSKNNFCNLGDFQAYMKKNCVASCGQC